jgi:micrococcal nuclease
MSFFEGATEVALEFPGTESPEVCLRKYRGNYGRVLAFVYRDGVDFQEVMIREGYSPYFTKYGFASFTLNNERYMKAESLAQMAYVGVWNQVLVNGQILRNYPLLSTWWNLRASLIQAYRTHIATGKTIYNTRLDYAEILAKAGQGKTLTIFTEVRSIKTIHNGSKGFIDIGSKAQPFTLYLPGLDSPDGVDLNTLLEQRYISSGEDNSEPRRSYLYVTGQLSLYNDDPQMKLTHIAQIADDFSIDQPLPIPPAQIIKIVAMLPNPAGQDAGHETVTLKNMSSEQVSLEGWVLKDRSNNEMLLEDFTLAAGATEEITAKNRLSLNNTGDEITLCDEQGHQIDKAGYTGNQVVSGQPIFF